MLSAKEHVTQFKKLTSKTFIICWETFCSIYTTDHYKEVKTIDRPDEAVSFEVIKVIEDDSVVDYLEAKGSGVDRSKRYEIRRTVLDGSSSLTSLPNMVYTLEAYFSKSLFIKKEMSQIVFNELVSSSFGGSSLTQIFE